MENIIYLLKRSNGMYGIYVNGTKQENLSSNFSLTDKAEDLIDRMLMETKKYNNVQIIFTDNEENFKSGLPSFQNYLTI